MNDPMINNLSDLERSLNLVVGRPKHGRTRLMPRAIGMSDTGRAPDPMPLLFGLPAGGAIILRHPDPLHLTGLVRDTIPVARRLRLLVLISSNPQIALKFGADGVHLPEAMVQRRPNVAWARLRPNWIITTSAHSAPALRRAQTSGADGALLSPVVATASHPQNRPLGYLRFSALCHNRQIKVYALGGISRRNLRRLKGSGCQGVAGIELFS
jgi:thiamine-phosphate pyrophosphorylase